MISKERVLEVNRISWRKQHTTAVFDSTMVHMGWKVMIYIPRARYLKKRFNYKRLVVVCNKRDKYLWNDVADEFEFNERRSRWPYIGPEPLLPDYVKKKYGCFSLQHPPRYKGLAYGNNFTHIEYGEEKGERYDLAINASRNFQLGAKDYGLLLDFLGYKKVCFVGDGYYVPGADDFRNCSMDKVCNALRMSKFYFGPMSPTAHLPALTGTSRILWGRGMECDPFTNNRTLRYVYGKKWNPFKVKTEFMLSARKFKVKDMARFILTCFGERFKYV